MLQKVQAAWDGLLSHFITLLDAPQSTAALEVKWGISKAGDSKTPWGFIEEEVRNQNSESISGGFKPAFN